MGEPRTTLSEWELWACASTVLRDHGDQVGDFLIARIRDMQAKGDHDGLATWFEIAERVQELYALPDRADLH